VVNRRRRYLLAGAIALTATVAVIWDKYRRIDPNEMKVRTSAIEARHGIEIRWGDPATFAVQGAANSVGDIPNGLVQELKDLSPLPAALDAIDRALGRYPESFFARHCKAIFICGDLRLDGVPAGGTYGDRWLLLVANPEWDNAMVMEANGRGLHHEFSSMLYSTIPEIPLRWSRTHPPQWHFKPNIRQTLETRGNESPRHDLGFLSTYGATTAENDFNTYAEMVMSDAAGVLKIATDYPLVKRKASLFLELYIRLDPRFERVFVDSGLGPIMARA
jgi:hypothetical protein